MKYYFLIVVFTVWIHCPSIKQVVCKALSLSVLTEFNVWSPKYPTGFKTNNSYSLVLPVSLTTAHSQGSQGLSRSASMLCEPPGGDINCTGGKRSEAQNIYLCLPPQAAPFVDCERHNGTLMAVNYSLTTLAKLASSSCCQVTTSLAHMYYKNSSTDITISSDLESRWRLISTS